MIKNNSIYCPFCGEYEETATQFNCKCGFLLLNKTSKLLTYLRDSLIISHNIAYLRLKIEDFTVSAFCDLENNYKLTCLPFGFDKSLNFNCSRITKFDELLKEFISFVDQYEILEILK